jgi:hypothetical protein
MTNNDTNAPISTFTHDPFPPNANDSIPTVRNPIEKAPGQHDVGHGNTDARPFDPKDVKSNPTPGER